MLVCLLSWIYIGLFCLAAGIAVRGILGRFFSVEKQADRMSVTATAVYGLVGITVYTEIFSLFSGVGAVCHLLLLALVILYHIVSKQARSLLVSFLNRLRSLCCSWEGFFLLFVILAAAYFTSRGTIHTDTNIYHAQAIRIIEEYGVVKGIANLQLHYGYNSSYLVFCAFFTMRWLTGTALHTTTGFLFALLGCWSFHGLKNFLRHRRHGADLMKVGILIYILTNLTGSISPATDYGSIILSLYMLTAFLETAEHRPQFSSQKGRTVRKGQPHRLKNGAVSDAGVSVEKFKEDFNASTHENNDNGNAGNESVSDAEREKYLTKLGMIAMGALFVVSMKLSAAALFLLVLYPLIDFLRRGEWRTVLRFVALGVVIFLPYLIRNVILSGWLFFPFPAIDLFNVEWKVPAEYVLSDSNMIKVSGREMGYDGSLIDTPMSEWIPIWWEAQQHYAQMLIYADILSIPLFLCDFFLARANGRRHAAVRPSAAKRADFPASVVSDGCDGTEGYDSVRETGTGSANIPVDGSPLCDSTGTREGGSGYECSTDGKSIRWEIVNVVATLYAGLAMWFLTSPIMRFGLAFILGLPLLAMGLLLENLPGAAAAGSAGNAACEPVSAPEMDDVISDMDRSEVSPRRFDIGSTSSNHAFAGFWRVGGAWLSILTVMCYCAWIDNYVMDDLVFIKQNLTEPYYITQKPFDDPEMGEVQIGDTTIYYAVDGEMNSYYVTPSTCYQFMLERTEMIGDTVKDGFRAKVTD